MLQRSARLQYALLALVAFFALTHFYLGVANSFDILANGHNRAWFPFFQGSISHAVRLTTPEAVGAGRQHGDTAMTVTLAMPELSVTADAALKVALAPLDGTAKNTVAPGTAALIESVTTARSADPNAVLTGVLWPLPLESARAGVGVTKLAVTA